VGAAVGAGIGGIAALATGDAAGQGLASLFDGTSGMRKSAEALAGSSSAYGTAQDKARNTGQAVKDYTDSAERLDSKIQDGTVKEQDYAIAADLQKQSIEALQDMYPGLISQYDIENGKLQEKLELIQRIAEAENKGKVAQLEAAVTQGRKDFSKVGEKVQKSYGKQQGWQGDVDNWYSLMPEIKGLEADYLAVQTAGSSGTYSWAEEQAAYEALAKRADEINQQTGWNFHGIDFATGDASESVAREIDKLLQSINKEQANAAKWVSQYEELYSAEISLLDAKYGGTLQTDIDKWRELNAQVKTFNGEPTTNDQQAVQKSFEELDTKLRPVIDKIHKLNEEMALIPKEKKVNIDVTYTETDAPKGIANPFFGTAQKPAGLVGPIPAEASSLTISGLTPASEADASNSTASYSTLPAITTRHAGGGIMTTPHYGIVAEDGDEAIIPLSAARRERGLALWERVGRIIGVKPYAEGGLMSSSGADNNIPPVQAAIPSPITSGGKGGAVMSMPVNIDNITFEINVEGGEGMPGAESLVETIRANVAGLTDEIAYKLAVSLQQAFANMPIASDGGMVWTSI
jgi:hypothetical protein